MQARTDGTISCAPTNESGEVITDDSMPGGEFKDRTVDEQAVELLACVRNMPMEKQIPFVEQIALRGADYRAAHLVVSIMIALLVISAMLVTLWGRRDPIMARSLILGIGVALICLFFGSVMYYIVRQVSRRRAEDPLEPQNLRSRLAYERDCAQQLIILKPTDEGLERATLELQAQTERYAGYTGSRNEFFRSYRELLLAGLLLFGVTPENADGELAILIQTIKWLGAALLLSAFWAGMFSSARVSKYKFWLSIVTLARYQIRLDAANTGGAGKH